MTCKRGGFLCRRPRAPHRNRRLLLTALSRPGTALVSRASSEQTAKMLQEQPWRSPRLKKKLTIEAKQARNKMQLPGIGLKSQSASKPEPKPKKMSRAMREREAVRQINEYRQRILERVNKECTDYREAMTREQEEKRNTTISFNKKKEVLEFCKKLQLQSRTHKTTAEPLMREYEIKSVLRGSNEVYVGRVSSKRNSILGDYNINEETVLELHSAESSMQKAPEDIPPQPEKKATKPSPKVSPKPSPRSSVEPKKDKPSK